ncbi:MAG: phytanoyl-CoA dioxygenase family protein [Mesorhizobium sp.]|uniref:Phytanoyl-CoA dioxygenase n=1 Tax=Mesorhizobium mediterraneum TaxID=43617 RepID=A0AB36R260_9HYPH|nr:MULTISPECIES: phytanoyl-CoA dioxygenase family protein [Mesorhizobium]RUU46459.1 phytanoyl-CoA dioxygenase family protein [Mesorhizobium sp. M6A.T.Ca.TU.002.02.2.1]AZO67106.1 phytanoyl-CoA dioxygenase family protein [Mesorhizobium sp. M6A.T.Cr.TU.016.01.1.1]PAP98419.1 phytanoyl-CoA dioxygenase [Mesorhizobium mediterraneum]RUU46122.1 phytanoyl-CoA dioxygenase family protein [Mesorhizobium sp. M6A.T.Ce.TU.002.03.1.1]RUU96842.1 phytanoyl-CoA dioxygenase family protein [Mesorhizobium sp. M6A.T.
MLAMTKEETEHYISDGYIIRKGLLSVAEVDDFRDHARRQLEAETRSGAVMAKGDKEGKTTLLKMWTKAEDDKYGLLARDERMVDLAQDAVGKPIYLYSHKMTMKQPNEGGAWEWHQDFGYWYNYGCLAPEMMSIYVALDKATRENGCLQVLKGSHKLGRLNHIRENDQTNVEQEHLEAALKRYEHIYVEMEAGDALIFDGNLLHRSDANRSDTYRWGYICSYNAIENAPFKKVREYGNYDELHKVPAGSFRKAS